MKFTLNWLKDYLDLNVPAEEIADRLTMLGLEVESIRRLHHDLAGIKVARILTVEPHPNADRLQLCQVAVGDQTVRVVCGAANARAGLNTAIALPGTTIPSGLKIREARVRGQVSAGMLCSEKELGISEEGAGIIELDDSLAPGRDLAEALDLADTVIEVDLTPNRPDCASVIGIAREVAGFTGIPLCPPLTAKDLPVLTGKKSSFAIEVRDPGKCPRYAARLLRNVKIGPSPWWLKARLLAIGQRPINNVVDITNLVMMEYGQPLHAFDFARLAGNTIVVRTAGPGETMTTLDGTERTFDPEMLLICDRDKPVAVAGVMGGESSEVSDKTVDILLESACFKPVNIRRTARRLNLSTESSYRFERGVDPAGIPLALERAARLMVELAGAELEQDGVDVLGKIAPPPLLTLRVGRTRDMIGMDLSAAEIRDFLAGIEFQVDQTDDPDQLLVHPPSFRVDIEREADLVEEVARLKGYNEIPATMPMVPMSFPEQDRARNLRRRLAGVMVAMGFSEVINYSFTSEQNLDRLGLANDDPLRRAVQLLNPLTEEQGIMRTMLLPGILENVRRNINQQNIDLRLFEVGKVFHPRGKGGQPEERIHLTAVLSGRRHPGASLLHFGIDAVDIHDARGAVENLLQELDLAENTALVATDVQPGYIQSESCSLVLSKTGQTLGLIGQLGPDVGRNFGIKQELFVLSLDLEDLAGIKTGTKKFRQLPRYPSVQWDIAVLVPEQVAAGDMVQLIRECDEPLVEQAELFDIYRGKPIEPGMKSVALTITYRSGEQTLDDETVDVVHQRIIKKLVTEFKGRLREAH
ncbi:MAG: phenylalanine--tRNA ligase subunit beta [Desulfobacterales bacterium]|nr:phenylalanine--tRNA ligase subunit beta [Desulfobacterales bacterium]